MKHEIIYTEDYALIVSDKQIKDVRPHNGKFHLEKGYIINQFPTYLTDLSDCKLIIAHRPLTDAAILKYVPLLPEFGKGDDVEKIADVLKVGSTYRDYEHLVKRGIIIGYNKAKETYKYTEEDMINAAKYGYEFRDTTSFPEHKFEDSCINNTKQWLQSLKQSKRPKYFECETITMNKGYTDKSDYPYQECEILKTITNPQGQTELSGKYIFE